MAYLSGNSGNNYIVGTLATDVINGAHGNDTLLSGIGDDSVFGSDGDDVIFNDFGNDLLDGGTGIDTIDFSYVALADDGSVDQNHVGVTFDMLTHSVDFGWLGHDRIYNFENVSGSFGNDKILGDNGANALWGGSAGNDYLSGRGGRDLLSGDNGADTLIGGTGADELVAYAKGVQSYDTASDVFRYTKATESGLTEGARDKLWGHFGGGDYHDVIDLKTIDADTVHTGNQAFHFIGDASFNSSKFGEVRVVHNGSQQYLVSVDTDGDNAAEMTMTVHSDHALVAADFIL